MSNKTVPVISLIIPTRERCETLRYTLKTAVDQASANYEIIVSDNYSKDDTKKVVEEFNDSRIKYLNTGERLSMCDNWDFALKHVEGDYVIIIGDDDGVMPGAIDKLQKFIESESSPIYFWRTHEYFWPINDVPPLISYVARPSKPFEMNLKKKAKFSIRWGGWRYGTLPLLYHAAVSRDILDRIREKTGRVFHSTNPDVFMAFALPVFSDKAINIGSSITVNGRSAKSNGGSFIAKDGPTVFKQFVEEYGDYRMHSTLDPELPFAINMIADTALVAMELFPEYYGNMKFNYTAMWAYMDRISFFNDSMDIISKRKEILKYHNFSVLRFIFYVQIHRLSALRRKILDYIGPKNNENSSPMNINEFVQVMQKAQGRQQIDL